MKPSKRVAVTGGIGAGKSMVMDIVKALGAYTIYSDEVNRVLLSNPSYIEKITNIFPTAVTQGVIDRRKLKDIVFNDKKSLIKLNSLAHPLISGMIISQSDSVSGQHVFVEIPLLIESGIASFFDRIWLVHSDLDERIKRAAQRDNVDEAEVKRIAASQSSISELAALSTDIIVNNGKKEKLWEEVSRLYSSL